VLTHTVCAYACGISIYPHRGWACLGTLAYRGHARVASPISRTGYLGRRHKSTSRAVELEDIRRVMGLLTSGVFSEPLVLLAVSLPLWCCLASSATAASVVSNSTSTLRLKD